MMSIRSGCVFCRIVHHEEAAYVVFEDAEHIVFLDKYPRTRGHMQIIPKRHVRYIYDLPDMGPVFSLTQKIVRAIIPVLGADHVTIGAFGNEIHHAHIWIVPQYDKIRTISEGRRIRKSEGQKKETAELLHAALVKEV
jgi:histidine triad (HIT) family protein